MVYGKRGSLEGWASGVGLLALARHLHPRRFADTESAADVGEAWRAGDPDAADVVERAARSLGRALALLVDLLAPEAIVLGNLASRLGPPFVRIVEDEIANEALPALATRTRIVCCALGEKIGDMAALSVALEAYNGADT
jgi:glucokinase